MTSRLNFRITMYDGQGGESLVLSYAVDRPIYEDAFEPLDPPGDFSPALLVEHNEKLAKRKKAIEAIASHLALTIAKLAQQRELQMRKDFQHGG